MINEKMRALGATRSVIRELFEYGKMRKAEVGADKVYDFSLGNPSVEAPGDVNEAISRLVGEIPSVVLHGYTSAQGDAGVRGAIAEYINRTEGEEVTADCLYLTVGAAAAIASSLSAVVTPGEEVIVPAPYFPEYKVWIERAGGVIKPVACDKDFKPDAEAIGAAITEGCAAVIINSPNNPTGAVYGDECIKELCEVLRRRSRELGKTIYLIADEPYRELVYDGVKIPYLTKFYDDTLVCYSFSKSLSLPGERIGYVLVSPRMGERDAVYQAVAGAARALGYVCAPSLLQRILPYCLGRTADISVYDRNRRLLLDRLTEYGYEVVRPEGAFYLFVKSPSGDAAEFLERAKSFDILIVPSDSFGVGGYARLAYCVTTEEIERALPAFRKLIESYK